MKFPYGISPHSLVRWLTFERICAIQEERGPEVGGALLRFIVNAELEAIGRATYEYECERDEVAVLRRKDRALHPSSPAPSAGRET